MRWRDMKRKDADAANDINDIIAAIKSNQIKSASDFTKFDFHPLSLSLSLLGDKSQ